MTGKDWKKACCPETRAVVHCGACSATGRAVQCFSSADEPGASHDAAGMKAAWKKLSATALPPSHYLTSLFKRPTAEGITMNLNASASPAVRKPFHRFSRAVAKAGL
ncbi:MAG TPA: hypothetical protein VF797_09060, partial [Noviherbaspirillum sp.]